MPPHVNSYPNQSPRHRPSPRWVIAETLTGPEGPSAVLDGNYIRHFANLSRVTIATNASVARRLRPLVQRCANSGHSEIEDVPLPSGGSQQLLAIPTFGPSNQVFAVTLCAGVPPGDQPVRPGIETVELNPSTGTARVSPPLRHAIAISTETDSDTTVSTFMSRFDRWDDREGFLSLFDLTAPSERWAGTTTAALQTGNRHHLFIAAKLSPARRSIHALMCDLGTHDAVPPPDFISAALRRLRLPEGHSIGIVDLRSQLIHEWAPTGPTPSGYSPSHLRVHPEDEGIFANACGHLLHGRQQWHNEFRMSIDSRKWHPVRAQWILVTRGARPQAAIQIAVRAE
ncbi:GAF domain-containing protein [Nocardia sp. NPDC004068]|uniref:GAF domain-containing protein n=1 Tax=Nocardia sp. NPDC004068 TaxID=3364303 RepID=UPI0036CB5426